MRARRLEQSSCPLDGHPLILVPFIVGRRTGVVDRLDAARGPVHRVSVGQVALDDVHVQVAQAPRVIAVPTNQRANAEVLREEPLDEVSPDEAAGAGYQNTRWGSAG